MSKKPLKDATNEKVRSRSNSNKYRRCTLNETHLGKEITKEFQVISVYFKLVAIGDIRVHKTTIPPGKSVVNMLAENAATLAIQKEDTTLLFFALLDKEPLLLNLLHYIEGSTAIQDGGDGGGTNIIKEMALVTKDPNKTYTEIEIRKLIALNYPGFFALEEDGRETEKILRHRSTLLRIISERPEEKDTQPHFLRLLPLCWLSMKDLEERLFLWTHLLLRFPSIRMPVNMREANALHASGGATLSRWLATETKTGAYNEWRYRIAFEVNPSSYKKKSEQTLYKVLNLLSYYGSQRVRVLAQTSAIDDDDDFVTLSKEWQDFEIMNGKIFLGVIGGDEEEEDRTIRIFRLHFLETVLIPRFCRNFWSIMIDELVQMQKIQSQHLTLSQYTRITSLLKKRDSTLRRIGINMAYGTWASHLLQTKLTFDDSYVAVEVDEKYSAVEEEEEEKENDLLQDTLTKAIEVTVKEKAYLKLSRDSELTRDVAHVLLKKVFLGQNDDGTHGSRRPSSQSKYDMQRRNLYRPQTKLPTMAYFDIRLQQGLTYSSPSFWTSKGDDVKLYHIRRIKFLDLRELSLSIMRRASKTRDTEPNKLRFLMSRLTELFEEGEDLSAKEKLKRIEDFLAMLEFSSSRLPFIMRLTERENVDYKSTKVADLKKEKELRLLMFRGYYDMSNRTSYDKHTLDDLSKTGPDRGSVTGYFFSEHYEYTPLERMDQQFYGISTTTAQQETLTLFVEYRHIDLYGVVQSIQGLHQHVVAFPHHGKISLVSMNSRFISQFLFARNPLPDPERVRLSSMPLFHDNIRQTIYVSVTVDHVVDVLPRNTSLKSSNEILDLLNVIEDYRLRLEVSPPLDDVIIQKKRRRVKEAEPVKGGGGGEEEREEIQQHDDEAIQPFEIEDVPVGGGDALEEEREEDQQPFEIEDVPVVGGGDLPREEIIEDEPVPFPISQEEKNPYVVLHNNRHDIRDIPFIDVGENENNESRSMRGVIARCFLEWRHIIHREDVSADGDLSGIPFVYLDKLGILYRARLRSYSRGHLFGGKVELDLLEYMVEGAFPVEQNTVIRIEIMVMQLETYIKEGGVRALRRVYDALIKSDKAYNVSPPLPKQLIDPAHYNRALTPLCVPLFCQSVNHEEILIPVTLPAAERNVVTLGSILSRFFTQYNKIFPQHLTDAQLLHVSVVITLNKDNKRNENKSVREGRSVLGELFLKGDEASRFLTNDIHCVHLTIL